MALKINIVRSATALMVGLAITACQPERPVERSTEPITAKKAPTPAPAKYSLNRTEFALIRAVNTLRKERGLEPLSVRSDLSKASRDFAKRLSARTFFAHVSPEGDSATDRADAVGYDWRRLGETLAAGQTSPREAAASWRDSPGHAKIIFDPQHVHVGAGYVRRKSKDKMKPELEHFWVLMAGATR